MTRTTIYWWSPSRSLRDLKPELSSASRAWLQQYASTRRVMKNFGDEFSPIAWELATTRRAKWAPPSRADVFAIGSILQKARGRGMDAAIWGTGARTGVDPALGSETAANILAVRGPRTAEGLALTSIPVGDPGLLVGETFLRRPARKRKLHIFLPHYRSAQTRQGREQIAHARSMGFTVVDAGASPVQVAGIIAEAQSVLTSSLHGLVFAHSLGTFCESIKPPATEPDFKYHDYFSSLGLVYSPVPNTREVFSKHLSQEHTAMMSAERDLVQGVLSPLLDRITSAAKSYYG